MKRKISRALALFVIFVMLFSLFSCEEVLPPNKESDTKTTETRSESEPLTEPEIPNESDAIIVYPDITLPECIEALIPSMVKIYCYDYDMKEVTSHGTGFFIDENGTFITNAHVVNNAFFVKARTHTGEYYDVDVIYSYSRTASDHAVCAISGYKSTPVTFDPAAELGEKVYALGYPGSTFKFYASEGEVVSVETTVGSITYIENTAVIYDGNSGGILANADGQVLGIATGSLRGGDFVAVTYSEFEKSLTDRSNPQTILERFHARSDIELSASNASTFFAINATAESEDNPPTITLVLREENRKKFPVDIVGDKITVTVNLVNSDGEVVGSPTTFSFTSRKDMLAGISVALDSSTLPKGSFSIKISSATGTIAYYD